jgi:hypothetical protein
MRASRLLVPLLLLLAGRAGAQLAPMDADDRTRLAEAFRLSDRVGERVWPGWRAVPMTVLLVTDSVEYLLAHPAPSPDFASLGRDEVLGLEVWARRRVFPPTLLATFPAVGGVPTIVVGRAPRTGKRSAEWVVTLLHEHFHQLQLARPGYWAGVAALDLAHGDTTGAWMLDYPFPYHAAPVARATERLAAALADEDLAAARAAWRALVSPLDASDRRYLEFQLWQEGVARWVEHAAAREAAAHGGAPLPAFAALPDHEPYAALAARQAREQREELRTLRLPERRRVAFYPLGAAMAALAEERGTAWRRAYAETPFTAGGLLAP